MKECLCPSLLPPPWWQTIWFRISSTVLVLGLIAGAFLWQRKSSKYRELKLEYQVSERTNELVVAKKEAEIAKAKAEVANKAKSQFLSNMSHELRTPLNGILGYAQILKRRHTDDYTASGLNVIQQSGDHLLTLINDILDISKIEAGKLELYPAEVHLPSFLKTILGIIRTRAEAKDILLMYEPLSSLPNGIIIDETRLRQVLLNLLSNAVKFTDTGQVSLTIETLPSATEGKKLTAESDNGKEVTIRFSVEDTGTGLEPGQMKTIFQPFEQVGDLQRRAEGTGLGLPISRRIVQLMGGDLHVESPPKRQKAESGLLTESSGQGSLFWFEVTLPSVTGMEIPEIPAANIEGYQGDRRKILAVDDKDYNRLVLTNMLTPLGFEVVTANNGQEGIEKTLSFKPDLILMDLVMPVKTGFDAVKELRKIPETKDTPIIAVSASVLKDSQQESLDVGCQAFLSKPIEIHKLLDLLKTHLHLEWLYSEENAGAMDKEEPLVAPPVDELKILHDLVHKGDIYGINERASHIETLSVEYVPFVRKLHELAQGFEIQDILLLVERYLDMEES